MNNDEFVKKIKEIGKIKDVREAFEKYPVEEEEHKGKIDAYLKKINKTLTYNNIKCKIIKTKEKGEYKNV